jgi:hypothetical protein
MKYKNGRDFELAVFGERSTPIQNRVLKGARDFSREFLKLIAQDGLPYPDTAIGSSLYFYIWHYLATFGLDPSGLIFRSSINTALDSYHYLDGLISVPQVFGLPVTIDTFNLNGDLVVLREHWIDTFEGEVYSESEFQTDLFRFKKGLVVSNVLRGKEDGFFPASAFVDLRVDHKRPENHFILTPYHVENYRRRREFAKMVAGYLAAKAGSHKTPRNKP